MTGWKGEGHVAERKVPFAFQTLSPEGRQLAAQIHHLLFECALDLVRAGVGSSGTILQSIQALLGISSYPLAHGAQGGLEHPRPRL